jgi:hypothetical protein
MLRQKHIDLFIGKSEVTAIEVDFCLRIGFWRCVRREFVNRREFACQGLKPLFEFPVVLQVSRADKFVAERLWCVLRLPSRKEGSVASFKCRQVCRRASVVGS